MSILSILTFAIGMILQSIPEEIEIHNTVLLEKVPTMKRILYDIIWRSRYLFKHFHIVNIRRMTINNLMEDPVARAVLAEYIIEKNPTLNGKIIIYWKCYELTKRILSDVTLFNERECFLSLKELSAHLKNGISWEDLQNFQRTEDTEKLTITLQYLKTDSLRSISYNTTFYQFCNDLNGKEWRIRRILNKVFTLDNLYNHVPTFLETLALNKEIDRDIPKCLNSTFQKDHNNVQF